MYVTIATLLALQCILCPAIRVPVLWNDNSEVNENNQFAVDQFQPQHLPSRSNQKPALTEYFQYPAQKPKFAVDIAKFHGVQSPENHYKSYPIKPHTGVPEPELGKNLILDKKNNIFHPYQEYVKKNEAIRTATPSTTSYVVFHPYKKEEPALKELYRDPVMEKVRSDLENSKIKLQKYENEEGEADIKKNEYLESPEDIDRKKVSHKNIPASYEIHRPQRKPVYYRPTLIHNQREQVLNQKLRHPWQQNHIKVKPLHYRPVKNHLQKLRQQHALKYDDEQNEYPQLPLPEEHAERPEGYDIYEKGKEKFVQLRNNVDESLNEAIQNSRPINQQKLELTDDGSDENTNSEEEEEDDFVPIKNYAQVRKTETTRHLPKEAAYHDADTLEEIQNAPRLREAVKSSKAQTVYSEEGYEDSAYDHGGEQKQASDHEAHGGFLKQKEKSSGKFKIPTLSDNYEDEERTEYRDNILDGKKWKDTKENTEKETESEDYSEKEQENSDESEIYLQKPRMSDYTDSEIEDERNNNSHEEEIDKTSRGAPTEDALNISNSREHDVNKREVKVEVPEIMLKVTNVSEQNKIKPKRLNSQHNVGNFYEKYPYYHNNFEIINKDSPLRYAENLKLIPKKSEGGTEFYDSRSKLQCPEVEDNIDPIPEKLKNGSHPNEDEEGENDENNEKTDTSVSEQRPRLRGLGDKIDCFKAKYFGENPLDSPFFTEEVIENPEPVTIPSIDIYKLKQAKHKNTDDVKTSNEIDKSKDLQKERNVDMFVPLDKLNPEQSGENPQTQINVENAVHISSKPKIPENQMSSVSSRNILGSQNNLINNNKYITRQQKNETKHINMTRKKRATHFVYEPYKILRDGQIQDSKKTTTTNNIGPLIKHLQSSRVVDKVAGKDHIVKRNVRNRTYKDIGKNEREKNLETKGSQPLYDASFVDVSVDHRRGEPRYELRSTVQNSQYSPVENKRSTTLEDHKAKKYTNIDIDKLRNIKKANQIQRKTTARPYFDVSEFLPQEGKENNYPSNENIEEVVDEPLQSQTDKSGESNESEEDDSGEDSGENTNTSKIITTTVKPQSNRKKDTETSTTTKPDLESKATETSSRGFVDEKIRTPKYREKKKKSTKSTLITDTNSYGVDDDDNRSKQEEVDALIGVDHDIKEYLPTYEKEALEKSESSGENSGSHEDFEDDDHSNEDEDEEDEDEDESDEDDDDDDDDDDEDEKIKEELKLEVTTSEPTKRTLIKTTEATLTTTEARSAKLEVEPVIVKKKLEIHKELPVNRSSPHITEYKQDIQEVEIIKEIPSRIKKKPQKNIEALELYKDENLAKNVNKLGAVEIFKEGLDLINGPKHGGNYRSAEIVTMDEPSSSSPLRKQNDNSSKADVVASQSKTSKLIELKEPYSSRRSNIQRARNSRSRSAKFIELSDSTERPTSRPMHGGNFKSIHDVRRRGGNRNAKIIELDEQNNKEDHSTNKHVGNPRSYGSRVGDRHQMHGGNYRSAKLVKASDIKNDKLETQTEIVTKKDISSNSRRKSAVYKNSFANAAPVLTTPTPYILDPSKRMYYFVDA